MMRFALICDRKVEGVVGVRDDSFRELSFVSASAFPRPSGTTLYIDVESETDPGDTVAVVLMTMTDRGPRMVAALASLVEETT